MDIEQLIRRWAEAVHTGDLTTVLTDHGDDIVMFDVPAPHEGVRGLTEYEKTWPPSFAWQATGASFEVVELDVTEGQDVAFAWALLKCGTPDELAAVPERRLRLTVGLTKRARSLDGHPRAPLVRRHDCSPHRPCRC